MDTRPDFERVRTALLCAGEPDRVPLAEAGVDRGIKEAVLGRPIRDLRDEVEFWRVAGYDFVPVNVGLRLMLNLGHEAADQERNWLDISMWKGPVLLSLVLLALMLYVLRGGGPAPVSGRVVQPKELSIALFGPYLMVVELASILLLAGLVGAYHLARRDNDDKEQKRS